MRSLQLSCMDCIKSSRKLAAEHIGDGLGGFVVEIAAALTIALYLGWLWMSGKWDQRIDNSGVFYCILTGLYVGAGTIAFFTSCYFKQRVPYQRCQWCSQGGAALMGIIGILFMKEPASWIRLLGIAFSIVGSFLLHLSPEK